MSDLLAFLDKIEGDGYGGMAVFESARTDAKELVAENERLRKESLNFEVELEQLKDDIRRVVANSHLGRPG